MAHAKHWHRVPFFPPMQHSLETGCRLTPPAPLRFLGGRSRHHGRLPEREANIAPPMTTAPVLLFVRPLDCFPCGSCA
jgi:hypothetical protein